MLAICSLTENGNADKKKFIIIGLIFIHFIPIERDYAYFEWLFFQSQMESIFAIEIVGK